jgi:anti-anti-sigma regulatory factor
VRQPPKRSPQSEPFDPLALLTGLGFGPDTLLMNDPKLFVDGRFLASLLVELEEELGERERAIALFQIGLLHGLRDAARVRRAHEETPASVHAAQADTTPLVMHWTSGAHADASGRLSIEGCWPERHEASARCSRLGTGHAPSCWMSAGYTTGWLCGTLDRTILAREVDCAGTGAETCRFEAREVADWLARGDAEVERLLPEIPFDAFRKVATSPPVDRIDGAPDPAAQDGRFDRSQPVVHIWGPVMVLPFTTLDEALGTVELLGRDPGITEIRAVIVDLRELPLDEGFGAAALEQILETIESWNAQSLITGVCPASEAAISSLESSHIVLRKDLSEAIATAFQVCDAQRHLV